jgi:hypothetical protein
MYVRYLLLPYNLEFKQHGPEGWGGGRSRPRQLLSGSLSVTLIAPPLRPVLLKFEIIRY